MPKGELDAFLKGNKTYDNSMKYLKKVKNFTGLFVQPVETALDKIPDLIDQE